MPSAATRLRPWGACPPFMCLPALTETQKCTYLSIVRSSPFVNSMPPGEEPEPQSRKRKRTIEPTPRADLQPKPQDKRRKRSRRPRSRTPPEFWDNLSRVPLCHRALRELDRRTVRPVTPEPLVWPVVKKDPLKQLERFSRHGGADLGDIRGFPARKTEAVRTMSSSQSYSSRSRRANGTNSSNASTKRTTISSKDAAFAQALIDADIYPENEEIEPENMEEIMERLGRPRPSLSPSFFPREKFVDFRRKNREAETESQVMSDVFPIIRGNTTLYSGQNQPFNHLEPLACGISAAQPDFYIGSPPAQLHPNVRNDLGPYIIPTNYQQRPLLPNYFFEAKGPKRDPTELNLQIMQDLACGARGMHKMQSYRQDEPVYDGNAYTLGSTYHSGTGTLQIYAMHPTEPARPGGDPLYHTTQMTAFAMTADASTFRRGAAAFRNARDWAKEQRDEFIARANERADEEEASSPAEPYLTSFTASSQNELSITSNTTHQDSGSSTDELARDTYLPRKRHTKSRQSGRRKRTTASPSAQESTAVESWTFAKGRFHCFRGETKVRSQKDYPRDVWVYNKDGWSNGGGKQWCFWESDGTIDYD